VVVSIHRFDIASLPAMPWKNGGGTTREIACLPVGAGLDDFDWRASIATIDRSGPFSQFAGVDRVIMLLDGAGVRLRSGEGCIEHRLDRPHVPFAFAGDVAIDGELLGARSSDFNLMTRRASVRADVRVLDARVSLPPADAGLLLALRGCWRLQGGDAQRLDAHTGLWWDGRSQGWDASPADTDTDIDTEAALLLAIRLEKLHPSSDDTAP